MIVFMCLSNYVQIFVVWFWVLKASKTGRRDIRAQGGFQKGDADGVPKRFMGWQVGLRCKAVRL